MKQTIGPETVIAFNPAVEIRILYRMIPAFKCRDGCSECCGSIIFRDDELIYLTNQERRLIEDWPPIIGLRCPLRGQNGCEIYDHRPLICRLFGHVGGMECPHNPAASYHISKEQEIRIMQRYLSGGTGWLMRPIPLDHVDRS